MPDWGVLAVFCATALAILLTPGPAVLYVIARSVDGGARAGLITTLGLASGSLAHVLVLVWGAALLLANSQAMQNAFQALGSVYLLFIALRQMRAAGHGPAERGEQLRGPPAAAHRVFLDAMLVSLLNPKSVLFLMAFVPQFVDTSVDRHIGVQLAVLGSAYVVLGLCTDAGYALCTGRLRHRLHPGTAPSRRWMRLFGPLLIMIIGLAGLAELAIR